MNGIFSSIFKNIFPWIRIKGGKIDNIDDPIDEHGVGNVMFNDARYVGGSAGLLAASNLSDVANPATSFTNIKQDATESATGVSEASDATEFVAQTLNTRHVTPKNMAVAHPVHGTTGDFSDDVTLGAGKHLVLPQHNDAVTPTLAFGDGDTGFLEYLDDSLKISIGGDLEWGIGLNLMGSDSGSGPGMLNVEASSTAPTLAPYNTDIDTGIGRAAADALSLIAGGVEGIRITESAGAITLDSPASYRDVQRISSSKVGLPSTNPPAKAIYGITAALEFTLNTDHVEYKKLIPSDWDGTDILVHVHWTKSTADDDQSGKFVKWQIKYLPSGLDENCNAGESTLTVEDEYPSAVTTTQVIAQTANMTIPAAEIAVHDTLMLQLMAVTPAGTPLDDEPAGIAVDIDIGRKVLHC